MTNYNERLDEVLSAVYLAGTENGLGRRITNCEEIMHRKNAFINGNHASDEAKQAILRWVEDEVIGEDELDNGYDKIIERMIKDKQRARIKELEAEL